MPSIRKAAVSGQFYPDDKPYLQEMIAHFLDDAISRSVSKNKPPLITLNAALKPKAIIVPHAGYIYSGMVAATAFSCLLPFKEQIKRIILLGPSHRVSFSGLATSSADYFQTPLGNTRIDQEANRQICLLPQVNLNDDAHQFEHSLEVELPFLQLVLGDFSLVPLVVGDANDEAVSEVLEMLWGDSETLVVISSDLSHFLDYESARQRDQKTCEAIESYSLESIHYDDACGKNPIKGLLLSAQKHALNITRLALCNSGDTAGDKARVVGYGAWVLREA